ncbi:hypothetical protein Tco_0944106, partial [Tanacetum coccineum]
MCPQGREHRKTGNRIRKLRLLLYQNTPYCLEEHDTLFRITRGLILNDMSNSLFDIYQSVESSKELWDPLKAKYMAEDASSKKFFCNECLSRGGISFLRL